MRDKHTSAELFANSVPLLRGRKPTVNFGCDCGATVTLTPDGDGGERTDLVRCPDCEVHYAVTVTRFAPITTADTDSSADAASN